MPRGRQIKREGRADMNLRIDRDESVVILDDRVGRREAEPVAFGFGREVRIENALEIMFRNAHAFVADADPNVIARRQIGDGRGRSSDRN